MVKSAPASPFEMSKTELLLQFLVVPFNDPTMLSPIDELF
jgi:hypothetical protein